MKKNIVKSSLLQMLVAGVLCLTFVLYAPSRISFASIAAPAAAPEDLKSASQFRSEAAQYDRAIRAVGAVATMKLDTADDLKRALEILARDRLSTKLLFSKLVTLALNDSTFAAAVKKKVPNSEAAEAFAKDLKADRKAILKLDGAGVLKSRLERSLEADIATLRRAADRLKAAAAKVKKSQERSSLQLYGTDEFKLVRVSSNFPLEPADAANIATLAPLPILFLLVVGALATASVVVVAAAFVTSIVLFIGVFGPPLAVSEECGDEAEQIYDRCTAAANILPPPFNLPLLAACEAERILRLVGCSVQ